jgi:hypothetical protein
MRLSTCLKGMTKNSPFLYFRAIFMSYCPLFWVSEVIYKSFWRFWAVSWDIVHSFGFSGWFWRPMTLSTSLIGMTKNSSFLCLWHFLWAIAHSFGVMGGTYMAHDTQYMFERHDQKLVIFTFLGRFHELKSTVLGFRGVFQAHDT